jgi:hypothetical protein
MSGQIRGYESIFAWDERSSAGPIGNSKLN